MTRTSSTPRTSRPPRRLVPAAVALAALALVAACGGSSTGAAAGSSGSTQTAGHNAADVAFATGMIPHHAQAVEMADMALATATDPQVKTLAQAIKGAQDPEIATMTGWLTDWKAPVPTAGMGHGMGHGMTAGSSMGMMSEADMAGLGQASGAAFDRSWVEMMIRHHSGAIAMARTELRDGRDAAAQALAQQIVTSQTAEVSTLTAIGTRLG